MRWLSVMRLARLVRSNVDRQLSSSGRSGRHGETGAVAMIVAMLFGLGVLLGLGALVIDTGSLLYERRQLQNGADAAAFAVGKDCAGKPTCAPIVTAGPLFAATTTLTDLAGANASSDGKTAIESICGNSIARASNLNLMLTDACPTSPTSTGQLVDCPPLPSEFTSAPYIEVRTKTLSANETNILPPILAQTLVGGGYSGETVRACSRVAWRPAGEPTGPVLPVAFSSCQWAQATGFVPPPIPPDTEPPAQGPDYRPPPYPGLNPGYGYSNPPNTEWPKTANSKATPPIPESELVFYSQGRDAPGDCSTWNNHTAPGTFGQLTQTGCNATVTDNWVRASNGDPSPCDMTTLGTLKGQIVNVPIFDCYSPIEGDFGTCNSTSPGDWYHISGYGAFYLTGFYFSSGGKVGDSIFPGTASAQPCKTEGDRCIAGWFTTDSLPATPGVFGTPFFGTYELQLAG